MKHKHFHLKLCATLSLGLWLVLFSVATAQVIPGPADAGRIRPEEKMAVPDRSQESYLR